MKKFLLKKVKNDRADVHGNCFICGGCWGICGGTCISTCGIYCGGCGGCGGNCANACGDGCTHSSYW